MRRAADGARVASGTGETIRKLADALRESSQAAREIAAVARQQDHGIDQVLAAMRGIELGAQETLRASHGLAGQARSLSDLAADLRRSSEQAAA